VSRAPHPFVHNFFLGHQPRCQEESIRSFRERLGGAASPESAADAVPRLAQPA
jgi:hypothetical protein